MSDSQNDMHVVVVGGVAGGAFAAARARRVSRKARVTLLEKGHHISFANCGLPYYLGGVIKDREKLLVTSPTQVQQRFGIEVRTRCEATRIDAAQKQLHVKNLETGEDEILRYDKLILSPGASPIVPKMPNVTADNVFTLRDLQDTDRIERYIEANNVQRIAVAGAGFIGLEMAEQFRERGMDVDLIEKAPQVLTPMDRELAQVLTETLRAHGVRVYVGDGVTGMRVPDSDPSRANGIELESRTLDTDLIIMGLGVRPNVQLAKDAGLTLGKRGGILTDRFQRTSNPDIYAVGDAVEYTDTVTGEPWRVALGGPANRAGRVAAKRLQEAGVSCAVVDGGTDAWVAEGRDVVRGKQVMSLERQVRIAAGLLVLLGVGLSFVHVGFIGISAFVGAGLVFAGVTDTCGMAMLLAKMPWNR